MATTLLDRDERANAITAWGGFALALAGACWMLPQAIPRGDTWQWASALPLLSKT